MLHLQERSHDSQITCSILFLRGMAELLNRHIYQCGGEQN
jgi:hypothetical protein